MAEDSSDFDFHEKATACDIVRFTFCDMNGIPRTCMVPGSQTPPFTRSGVTWWSGLAATGIHKKPKNCPKEVEAINHGNATAVPMPGTYYEVTWCNEENLKIGEVLCETRWLQDNTPQAACPRYVARKQLEALEMLGYKLQSTFELEFSLLDPETMLPAFNNLGYLRNYQRLFAELSKNVTAGTDIQVESSRVKFNKTQMEITVRREEGIKAADATFIMKQAIKDVCAKNNLLATFMTRPFEKEDFAASDCSHFNHSIWTLDGQNAFSDTDGDHRLSDTARHWVGGLIKHAGALTALCSPTVNCYRRLHKPRATNKGNWGIDDRFTSFRVKNCSQDATYMENRIASGSCNPYLTLAATVAAGMDGIKTKTTCPPQRDAHAKDLPFTLGEALEALRHDHVMCEALGQQFVDWFILMKNETEISKLEQDLSKNELSKERDMYLKL